MTASERVIARIIDCRGLYCPVPIIRASEEIRHLSEGEVLELLADDPGVREDLPAWCLGTGHELLALVEEAGVLTGRVRKRTRQGRAS